MRAGDDRLFPKVESRSCGANLIGLSAKAGFFVCPVSLTVSPAEPAAAQSIHYSVFEICSVRIHLYPKAPALFMFFSLLHIKKKKAKKVTKNHPL